MAFMKDYWCHKDVLHGSLLGSVSFMAAQRAYTCGRGSESTASCIFQDAMDLSFVWPTSEFPHPLSRVKQSAGYILSYQIVDSLIWFGIQDMVNDLRKKKLKLRPVTYLSGSQGSESDVPYGYIWSPHLVPKPKEPAFIPQILSMDQPNEWCYSLRRWYLYSIGPAFPSDNGLTTQEWKTCKCP